MTADVTCWAPANMFSVNHLGRMCSCQTGLSSLSIVGRCRAELGHDKLDTTARYTRVAIGIESPLDLLAQPRKNVTSNKIIFEVISSTQAARTY